MSGAGIRQVSDEIKTLAFEKNAQIKIYQLELLARVIDLGCKRGAFGAAEASQIGALFDTLAVGVNKAYDIVEEELKRKEEIKLPVDEIKTLKI